MRSVLYLVTSFAVRRFDVLMAVGEAADVDRQAVGMGIDVVPSATPKTASSTVAFVLGGIMPATCTAPRRRIESSSRALIRRTALGRTASSSFLPVSVSMVNCGTNSRALPVRLTTR